MLVEFSTGNYRSFREPVTLSLLASTLRDDPLLDARNIFQVDKLSLLRSAAIYGANASGKSNLVRALMTMRSLVLDSATKIQAGEKLSIERFRLDVSTRQQPAYFQVVFLLGGKRYRYGFEADDEQIQSEWLYHAAQRETRLFVRAGQEFDVSAAFKREAPVSVQQKTRNNALFLSVLSQFNSATANQILDWFRNQLNGIASLNDIIQYTMPETVKRFESDGTFHLRAEKMMQVADVGIVGLSAKKVPLNLDEFPEEWRDVFTQALKKTAEKEGLQEFTMPRIETQHILFENGQQVGKETFDMEKNESDGTQKFFALLGPVLDALDGGQTLVIDELEARLHPLLTREMVSLFNSPETNPHHAQLIFATHDAGLLGECLLRRDQVWFTQKNRYGATDLYSLAEMKERKDASYLKNYLDGRYGGIPLLGGLRPSVEQELEHGA